MAGHHSTTGMKERRKRSHDIDPVPEYCSPRIDTPSCLARVYSRLFLHADYSAKSANNGRLVKVDLDPGQRVSSWVLRFYYLLFSNLFELDFIYSSSIHILLSCYTFCKFVNFENRAERGNWNFLLLNLQKFRVRRPWIRGKWKSGTRVWARGVWPRIHVCTSHMRKWKLEGWRIDSITWRRTRP